jgi:hypothetical protein
VAVTAAPPSLLAAVASAQRRLAEIYRLELDLRAERFVVSPERARRLLPPSSPRSGVVVVQEPTGAQLGLYVDPADHLDPDTIVEETSHLVCLAWHAAQGRPVSRLILELQGEIDRYAVARLDGRDGLGHFRNFRWDGWMGETDRRRYEAAHRRGLHYCRSLQTRYPDRSDTPALLAELRRFYRAPSEEKLRLAVAY